MKLIRQCIGGVKQSSEVDTTVMSPTLSWSIDSNRSNNTSGIKIVQSIISGPSYKEYGYSPAQRLVDQKRLQTIIPAKNRSQFCDFAEDNKGLTMEEAGSTLLQFVAATAGKVILNERVVN